MANSPQDEAQGYAKRLILAAMEADTALRMVSPVTGRLDNPVGVTIAFNELDLVLREVRSRYGV